MLQKNSYKLLIAILMLVCNQQNIARTQNFPRLQKNGDATQLIVDDKPFLILGGELHNSSSSNLEYLEPTWQQLKDMNLNTVLAVVSWQLMEPEENKFDFSLVDGLLQKARENNLKLVLLWFGSWKNGLSHYAPSWVKIDANRFPRIKLENGKSTETLSPFSLESQKADAKAFAALMAHLKEVDSIEKTVIMMQVENEVGVLGSVRDNSEIANNEFRKNVPKELISGLKKYNHELNPQLKDVWQKTDYREDGSWIEIFGDKEYSEELFMAWQYASYMNAVTVAGKTEYNLPMFVNAWIVQPEDKKPGDYPSGGPQAHVHDIWRIAAPDIDILTPDVYLPNFPPIAEMYHHAWNPLFVPESFSGEPGASNAFYTIGKHAGIGYSPFGIDNYLQDPSSSPLAKAYHILNQLSPIITKAQSEKRITAFSLSSDNNEMTEELGGYKITASLSQDIRTDTYLSEHGYGLVIWENKDEFIIAGSNISINFIPHSPGPQMAGFISIYEGEYIDGVWKSGRLLNGDNIMINYDLSNEASFNRTGTGAKFESTPSILKVKVYRFE